MPMNKDNIQIIIMQNFHGRIEKVKDSKVLVISNSLNAVKTTIRKQEVSLERTARLPITEHFKLDLHFQLVWFFFLNIPAGFFEYTEKLIDEPKVVINYVVEFVALFLT